MSEAPPRLALSIAEAAASIGVSERHLRTLLPEVPHCYVGNRVVIPVEPLREWLRDHAKADKTRADAVAREILRELDL